MTDVISIEKKDIRVVSIGQVGPPGPPGSGGGGEIFITDVAPTSSGLVGSKTYVNGTPELATCMSDTTNVRVSFGCEGGADKYVPSVTINGVAASIYESATKRWFTGYADVVLVANQNNTLTAVSDAGSTDTATCEVLGAGPAITSIVLGSYPGTQTELKQGDTIQITINTEIAATGVTILSQGATGAYSWPVSGGVATGNVTISNASGAQVITAKAQNSFGTFGATFDSPALSLNQTYPTVGAFTVTYPASQAALGLGESGTVSATVSNFDTIAYISTDLVISNDTTYAASKSVANARTGYVGSGTNYSIQAFRNANGALTTASTLVRIATVAPQATISIATNPSRLTSSPSGIDYEIRITPDQLVSAAPTLTASHGAWQGSWTNMGSYWKRSLRITDAVARGAATFSGLSMVGPSGISGSAITAGSGYYVGGFSSRTVTFPAFSRVAPLGVAVSDPTKLTFSVGATTYTRYADNAVHTQGYYPANVDGSYNANGTYVGLSDSVFAGANTTGTLQGEIVEAM